MKIKKLLSVLLSIAMVLPFFATVGVKEAKAAAMSADYVIPVKLKVRDNSNLPPVTFADEDESDGEEEPDEPELDPDTELFNFVFGPTNSVKYWFEQSQKDNEYRHTIEYFTRKMVVVNVTEDEIKDGITPALHKTVYEFLTKKDFIKKNLADKNGNGKIGKYIDMNGRLGNELIFLYFNDYENPSDDDEESGASFFFDRPTYYDDANEDWSVGADRALVVTAPQIIGERAVADILLERSNSVFNDMRLDDIKITPKPDPEPEPGERIKIKVGSTVQLSSKALWWNGEWLKEEDMDNSSGDESSEPGDDEEDKDYEVDEEGYVLDENGDRIEILSEIIKEDGVHLNKSLPKDTYVTKLEWDFMPGLGSNPGEVSVSEQKDGSWRLKALKPGLVEVLAYEKFSGIEGNAMKKLEIEIIAEDESGSGSGSGGNNSGGNNSGGNNSGNGSGDGDDDDDNQNNNDKNAIIDSTGDGPIYLKLYKTIELEGMFSVDPKVSKNTNLIYKIKDPNIAVINPSKLQMTGMEVGKTKLTISTANGKYSITKTVYVTKDGGPPTGEDEVGGVGFDRETYNIRVDDVIRLNPVIQPFTAMNKECTWETSDAEIAEVDEYGNVRGVGQGIAAITVTTDENGYKAVARVMVRPYLKDEDIDEDPYHYKNDPQYDVSTYEKEIDTKKFMHQIDSNKGRDITVKLGTEFILPAEAIEYVRDNEKVVTFEHTNYQWVLDYRDIPEGDIHKDMNLKVSNRPVFKEEMTNLLTEDATPQYLDFYHDGEMPVLMTFKYRTNRSSPPKGFYFYSYNSGFDMLEIADEKLKTDSSRFVSIPMSRCAPSVLTLTEQGSNDYLKFNPFTGR